MTTTNTAAAADTRRWDFLQFCTFLFIALCPVQDFFLQGTPLRSLGASPSIFPLATILLVIGTRWLLSGRFAVRIGVLLCFLYILITTVYGLFTFGISSHGENLLWKATTSFISLGAIIFAATSVDYSKSRAVRAGIYCALAIVTLGFCFGYANPFGFPQPVENSILHFTPISDLRPRGLSSEPSELSISALVIGLLAVHVTRKRSHRILLFVLTLLLLIASGSKGGILTLFLCAIVICIFKWHSKWYQVPATLFIMLPAGITLIYLLPNLFPEDSFALSGTVGTRFSMLICALQTVWHHPFGVGLAGFLPAVRTYLPGAMSTLQSFFRVPLNFTEVSGYLESADMVSTKTFFFDQAMRFGIPFAICFVVFVTKMFTRLLRQEKFMVSIAILASAIAVSTYIPGTGAFAVPLAFGVALTEVKYAQNFSRV